MDEFRKMLQDIVNQSYEEKVAGAKRALLECYQIVKNQGLDQEQSALFVVTFLATAIASDGVFSAAEQKFIAEIFDLESVESLVRNINQNIYNIVDEMVDSLSRSDKSTFCLFAIYVLAVDDQINPDEMSYLANLLA